MSQVHGVKSTRIIIFQLWISETNKSSACYSGEILLWGRGERSRPCYGW